MRKQLWLVVLFSLLLVSGVYGAYRYYDPYYGDGFSFAGYTLTDIYAQYGIFIDAAIVLLIFLNAAKIAFKKHFGEEKVLYITVGIALALAFLLWEERTGFSLLETGGGLVIWIILGALVFVIARFVITSKALTLTSASLTYIVLYLIAKNSYTIFYYIDNISYRIGFDIQNVLRWIFIASFFTLAFSIFQNFSKSFEDGAEDIGRAIGGFLKKK